MRKIIALLLVTVSLMCSLCFTTGCGTKADYSAPLKMLDAVKNGEDITNKTVEVVADKDYFMGQIFYSVTPDLTSLIVINVSGEGAEDVKENDTVIVRIKKVDYRDNNLAVDGTIVK